MQPSTTSIFDFKLATAGASTLTFASDTMKLLTATYLLLTSSAFTEPIPTRDPFSGESRPGWWWDIRYSHVVVVEGKITFKKSEEPDVRIELNKERMKDIIPDNTTRELQSKLSDFYVGEIEISKFHYADGGGNLQQMRDGGLKRLKVLIPIRRFAVTLYGMNLQPDVENIGIHVLEYSNLILGLPLVYKSEIPNERLMDAQEVFKLREKEVHTEFKLTLDPNRGYAGFHFETESDAVVIGNVFPGTPANKIGMTTGDVILSINGEKIGDPDRGSLEKLISMSSKWKVGDQIEIEIQRGTERHKLPLKLISGADLQELMESEQGGADQPTTAPELKLEGKDKPQPESKVAPR